jgi:hypothetical protein
MSLVQKELAPTSGTSRTTTPDSATPGAALQEPPQRS